MKFSNIWKAMGTTLIGALVPIITGAMTAMINGSIDWTAVKASLIPAILLALTDALKEIQNEIAPPKA
jgi:1,4-dihydroxy-2-naphthoate octaprenyltransferase